MKAVYPLCCASEVPTVVCDAILNVEVGNSFIVVQAAIVADSGQDGEAPVAVVPTQRGSPSKAANDARADVADGITWGA